MAGLNDPTASGDAANNLTQDAESDLLIVELRFKLRQLEETTARQLKEKDVEISHLKVPVSGLLCTW